MKDYKITVTIEGDDYKEYKSTEFYLEANSFEEAVEEVE